MDRTELIVKNIGERIKKTGIKAVLYYTRKFDRTNLKRIVFGRNDFEKSYRKIGRSLKHTYRRVYKNIFYYHRELRKEYIKDKLIKRDGVNIRFSFIPLRSVGVYVPGGKYPYPSTVFMTVVPAKVSGVKEVYVATPPKNLNDEVLAACHITGVDKLYSIGGAQAIFSFAYGISPVKKVDKIIGPGNRFVNEAKRQVFGILGIDSLAGPSEVAVLLLRRKIDFEFIGADLLAQLEHGEGTSSYFITDSKIIYDRVKKELKKVRAFYFKSKKSAINKVNDIAPEHLIFIGEKKYLKDIRNAGTVFVGENSTVSFGDYVAGVSHVLPTGGTARFSSGLTIFDFYRTRAEISYSRKGVLNDFKDAIIFAKVEGMENHRKAVEVRVKNKNRRRKQ